MGKLSCMKQHYQRPSSSLLSLCSVTSVLVRCRNVLTYLLTYLILIKHLNLFVYSRVSDCTCCRDATESDVVVSVSVRMEERVIRCLEHVTVHREFVVTSVKMDVQQV